MRPIVGRRPRSARRFVWTAVLLAVLATVGFFYTSLEAAVPKAVGSYLARRIDKATGAKTTVALRAAPFWELVEGRFDSLDISASHLHVNGRTIASAHLAWTGGTIDVGQLLVGVVAVRRVGTLTATATLTTAELAAMIPSSLSRYHPHLAITARGITFSGTASVAGLTVPVALRGTIVPGPSGKTLMFHPAALTADGKSFPIPKATQVFSLTGIELPQGVSLVITGVTTAPGALTVHLSGVAA